MVRVLLADDDDAMRDFASRTLDSLGHEVSAFMNGSDALENLRSNPGAIDLLVTDIDMPILDGVSLAQKALEIVPGLKILLMSGFDTELDRAGKLPAACAGVLSKPFTLDEFRAAVNELLG